MWLYVNIYVYVLHVHLSDICMYITYSNLGISIIA